MRRIALLTLLVGRFAGSAGAAPPASDEVSPPPASRIVLRHCLVTPIDDVKVPALRGGRLAAIAKREGTHAAANDLLAQIDDAEARWELQTATAARDAGKLRSESTLREDEAEAVEKVAAAEHEAALRANRIIAGSVSDIDVRRLQLTVRRAAIGREVLLFDRNVERVELGGLEAKVQSAHEDLERRRVRAPFDGEIAEIYGRVGEWAEPGTPLVRVVRLDRLRVEGFVKVVDLLPADIVERAVEVTVELKQAARSSFPGRITFVSPLVQAGGEYRIWAEVENRRDRGHWLLRPGLEAEMSIVP